MKCNRFLALLFVVVIALTGCKSAKPDPYVETSREVMKILSEQLKIPVSKIARTDTLENVGMVKGNNDQKLKETLEAKFNVKLADWQFVPTLRVDELVTLISEAKTFRDKTEFGPIAPQASEPTSKQASENADQN